MLHKVIIIDYKLSNLFSVDQACRHVGLIPVISSDKKDILSADALILPGVGSFGDAIKNLEKLDLIGPVKDAANSGKPFMGICLGMQLLFSESEEYGQHKGLDIIKGQIKKFPKIFNGARLKVPHIGWNTVYKSEALSDAWSTGMLSGIKQNEFMYFVHSFYALPEQKDQILTLTNYSGLEYCSAIQKRNIFAFQYHPEKSGEKGIEIYKNFKKLIEKPA